MSKHLTPIQFGQNGKWTLYVDEDEERIEFRYSGELVAELDPEGNLHIAGELQEQSRDD